MQRTLFGGDVFPRSSVTTKLPTYKGPSGPPLPEEEAQAYRDIIVDVVYIAWRKFQRPISLDEIYYGVSEFNKEGIAVATVLGVKDRVQSRIDNELWPYAPYVRSKRTVDRRVNEAASDDFCPDNVSFLAAVDDGIYQPNPQRMVKK